MSLQFRMAPEVTAKGVSGCYSLLIGIDQRDADAAAISAFVDQAVATAQEKAGDETVQADLAGYDTLHRAFGVPTRKLFAAPQTLMRYVMKRGDIPRIAPLVDLYNAVSLETGLALGAHDARQIEGDVSLRLTSGSERFHPVGANASEAVRPGEYAYIDDANDVLCRLEVRQVEKTKVTPVTTDLFLIVQGNPVFQPTRIRDGHDRLIAVLRQFVGGTFFPLHTA